MKAHLMKYTIGVFAIILSLVVNAQIKPVVWNYSANKLTGTTYEIHLTATIQDGWHTYSQFTPEGGPFPTKISFKKSPLVFTDGKTKEIGELHQKYEDAFGVDVKFFSSEVDFVQVVQLKSKIKSRLTGTIQFMACTDKKCMPPETIIFNLPLN